MERMHSNIIPTAVTATLKTVTLTREAAQVCGLHVERRQEEEGAVVSRDRLFKLYMLRISVFLRPTTGGEALGTPEKDHGTFGFGLWSSKPTR